MPDPLARRCLGAVITCALATLVGAGGLAQAQGADVRPGDEKPELPSFPPREGDVRSPLSELPPVPDFAPPPRPRGGVLPPLPARKGPQLDAVEGGALVTLREVRVRGVTALRKEVVEAIALPYVGLPLGFEDLERLRDDLTNAYVERGFATSGVVIPDQLLADGVLELWAVEGRVTEIAVETDGRLRESYVERRLAIATGPPVNVNDLEQALQLLQQDEKIRSVAAELVPGERRGEARLLVRVVQTPPFRARIAGNNYSSPAIGNSRSELLASWNNVTGFGDSLTAEYEAGEGLHDVRGRWEWPLSPWDTAFAVDYRRTWSEVVADPFEGFDIGIESRTQSFGLQLSQPLYRRSDAQIEAFVIAAHRRSESFLFGDSYSFVPGPEDGVAKLALLRFGASAAWRSRHQVVAARTLFSRGFPWLGATRNDRHGVPDAKFFAWLGQIQWAGRFPDLLGLVVVARADVQLADSPLFSLEQFAVGGHSTVRGYRENRLVRDNGVVASLELRLPLPTPSWREWRPVLELAPFFDVGRSWNTDRDTIGPKTLMSVGVGGRLGLFENLDFEVYWGKALESVEDVGDGGLQDHGVHLGAVWSWP